MIGAVHKCANPVEPENPETCHSVFRPMYLQTLASLLEDADLEPLAVAEPGLEIRNAVELTCFFFFEKCKHRFLKHHDYQCLVAAKKMFGEIPAHF